MRIVVLGYIVRGPLGGLAWHHLQYVLGLHRLGHDVLFLEDSDDYPACYDPEAGRTGIDPSYGLRFIARTFRRFDLSDRWAYHDAHAGSWLGPAAGRALDACARADVVLNLSGLNPLRPWLEEVRVRALVDTDPVFTQIRHLTEPDRLDLARRHTHLFTFGENVDHALGRMPSDGLDWLTTRQPVVLSAWTPTPPPAKAAFTTVMQWESYDRSELDGAVFGMKAESLWAVRDLPGSVAVDLEIALGADPRAPVEQLRDHGWRIRDARPVTRTVSSYAEYLAGSRGEFSVAKHGYVAASCGWFSERSANYLASGRPCVVQDTGFGTWLETGLGVVSFSTLAEAADALREVDAHLDTHARAAREVAETYFDADRVLSALLDDLT